MENKIITMFCIIDDILKALNIQFILYEDVLREQEGIELTPIW